MVERQIADGSSALVPCGSHRRVGDADPRRAHRGGRASWSSSARGPRAGDRRHRLELHRRGDPPDARREARPARARALLISPYYNKPTQDGICRALPAVAEATRLPLIVYNIPGRTGSKIEADDARRASPSIDRHRRPEGGDRLDSTSAQEVIRQLRRRRSPLYSGDDSLTLPIIAVGGVGVISAIGNLVAARDGGGSPPPRSPATGPRARRSSTTRCCR